VSFLWQLSSFQVRRPTLTTSHHSIQLGDRTLLIIGDYSYAVRVNKSLAVFASSRSELSDILDQHSGKRKAKPQQALLEGVKRIKPEETPIWMVAGEVRVMKEFLGITGLKGTISVGVDAEIRIDATCETEDKAKELVALLKLGHEAANSYLKEPAKSLWQAADLKAKQDGKMVTVSGKVSSARIAEEYAKLK
jgi:hypothetical protein